MLGNLLCAVGRLDAGHVQKDRKRAACSVRGDSKHAPRSFKFYNAGQAQVVVFWGFKITTIFLFLGLRWRMVRLALSLAVIEVEEL